MLMTVASFREGNGTPLQYSCLENPVDGGAWWATVHGVAKNQTRLSDFTFTLEKEMATHSSILAWKIPWTGEPGRLQSMGRQRVRRDCATSSLHSTSLSGRQWQGSFFLDQWDSESGPIPVRNPVGRAGHTHSRCSLLEGLKSLDLEPRRPSVVT